MRHVFLSAAALAAAIALAPAPAAANGASEPTPAPAQPADAAPAPRTLGQTFHEDLRAVGRGLGGLIGVVRRDTAPIGERADVPTPADPGAAMGGAPFNTQRSADVREAAGVAAARTGTNAAVAVIEGARRPAGPDGPVALRLRMTDDSLYDAALTRDRRGAWRVLRLHRLE